MAQWVGQVRCRAESEGRWHAGRRNDGGRSRRCCCRCFAAPCLQSSYPTSHAAHNRRSLWRLLLLQNYPDGYAGLDFDALLQQPVVAAAAAEHLAANAASRAATPTAMEAEQAAEAAVPAPAEEQQQQQQQGYAAAEVAGAPDAAAETAAPMETEPAVAAPALPEAAAALESAGSLPRPGSPRPAAPGSLPPSPRERPLSAAAADLVAAAEQDGLTPPEYAAGDPTLGQVFASYLRPQLAQGLQSLKAAAGAAAAAAQHQLTAAQAQLLQHSGTAGVSAEVGEAAAAVAGGLLGAVAGGHRAARDLP